MVTEVKVWARIGAYITVQPGVILSDLDSIDFDMLYAENKLTFDGDSYVPEECLEDIDVVQTEEADFSLSALPVSSDTGNALQNVLTSISDIPSYISHADCKGTLKDDITEMSERFLKAVQHRIQKEFK